MLLLLFFGGIRMLNTDAIIHSYEYSIKVVYLDKKKGKNIEIPVEKVTQVAIDFNYNMNTMPMGFLIMALDRKFRDYMIKNMSENTILVNIKKRCRDFDDVFVDYIKPTEFKYFIDIEYNKRYDYRYQDEGKDDLLTSTGVVILPLNSLVNNKKIKNTNIFDTDMSTIVSNFTFPLGKILMQPLTYNTHVHQIIVPKTLTTIRQCLEYFNSDVAAFHDTMPRFFIDHDQTYLIDSSGKPVVKKGETILQVYIDVFDLDDLHPTFEYGMAIEPHKRRYYIPSGIQAFNISDPTVNITSNNITKIVGVDADGNKVEYSTDLTNGKGNKNATKVVNVDNNNLRYVQNVASSYKSSSINVIFTKSDLDSSVITMNKEFMINFVGEYKNKSGRYIMNRKREFYTSDNDLYRLNTTFNLNKVELV